MEYSPSGAVASRLYWRFNHRDGNVEARVEEPSVLEEVSDRPQEVVTSSAGIPARVPRYRHATFDWELVSSRPGSSSSSHPATTPSISTPSGTASSSTAGSSLPTPPSLPRPRPVAAPRRPVRPTTLCIPEPRLGVIGGALDWIATEGVSSPEPSADLARVHPGRAEVAASTLSGPVTPSVGEPTARLRTSSGWVDVYARPTELDVANTTVISSSTSRPPTRSGVSLPCRTRSMSQSTPVLVTNCDYTEVSIELIFLKNFW